MGDEKTLTGEQVGRMEAAFAAKYPALAAMLSNPPLVIPAETPWPIPAAWADSGDRVVDYYEVTPRPGSVAGLVPFGAADAVAGGKTTPADDADTPHVVEVTR